MVVLCNLGLGYGNAVPKCLSPFPRFHPNAFLFKTPAELRKHNSSLGLMKRASSPEYRLAQKFGHTWNENVYTHLSSLRF